MLLKYVLSLFFVKSCRLVLVHRLSKNSKERAVIKVRTLDGLVKLWLFDFFNFIVFVMFLNRLLRAFYVALAFKRGLLVSLFSLNCLLLPLF